MKKSRLLLLFIIGFLISCTKSPILPVHGKQSLNVQSDVPFVEYTIAQGNHYCDKNPVVAVNYQRQRFIAVFDSSAAYQTVDPVNQYDINKLYGFSDNNTHHHQNSARFGWRWSDSALRIFAYVYNDGQVMSREMLSVTVDTPHSFEIEATDNFYIFTVNETKAVMPRTSRTNFGQGYKLYPYFGGDEVAPHAICIRIQESK